MSLTKCRAIVLKTIDYSESSVVLKCYTNLHGIQSYLINGVRSRKGNIRPSQLQPLTLLELESYHQQNKNLQRIKELKCAPSLRTLHFDIIKSTIGIFLAELVHKSIKEENHTDEPLFEFLFNAIQILDLEHDHTAHFPIYFSIQLTRYLGFFPKGSYSDETNGFDLAEGSFSTYDTRNPFQAEPILSEKLSAFLASDFNTMKMIPITHAQRMQLLEHVLDYYREHIAGFGTMKSPKILREILE
jgi:DNA repair protein RecO (recombination protein O)